MITHSASLYLTSVLIWGSTWFASIGNIISVRNQKHDIPVIQTNAWGMAYGAVNG